MLNTWEGPRRPGEDPDGRPRARQCIYRVVIVGWLRRQPRQPGTYDVGSDRWRYILVGAVALASTVIAITGMLTRTRPMDEEITLHYVAFWCSVYFIAAFSPLFVIASLVAYAYRKMPDSKV